MSEFGESFLEKKDDEEMLYKKRADFIVENYSISESNYEIEELLASGLDGKQVLEKKDESDDLEGILTYEINKDNEKVAYCSIGIMLTREESKGEGVMKDLISKLKNLSKENNCEYIVAIADTQEGEEFLSGNGFYLEEDSINGREYFRFDLE